MVRAEENTASPPFRKEFTEPDYWHPKSENFDIIDWKEFEKKNPTPPAVLTLPQRNAKTSPSLGWTKDEVDKTDAWLNRTEFKPPGEWAKPDVGKIDDESLALFRGLLGRSPDSSKVPEPFRNRLFWMQNNHLPEDLVSFNRAAWRSAAKEGEKGRVVGLSCLAYDWTNSPNENGYKLAKSSKDVFANFQVSPDGKWIKLFLMLNNKKDDNKKDEPIIPFPIDPSKKDGRGRWMTFYVVQEGDKFKEEIVVQVKEGDKDSKDKLIEKEVTDIKPGDLIRLTYEGKDDPYECDNKKIIFSYRPVVVAEIDDETGEITTKQPYYDQLVESATKEMPTDTTFDESIGKSKKQSPGNTTFIKQSSVTKISDPQPVLYPNFPDEPLQTIDGPMQQPDFRQPIMQQPIVKPIDPPETIQNRWDIQVEYISNTQRYYASPEPPYGAAIENIVGSSDDTTNEDVSVNLDEEDFVNPVKPVLVVGKPDETPEEVDLVKPDETPEEVDLVKPDETPEEVDLVKPDETPEEVDLVKPDETPEEVDLVKPDETPEEVDLVKTDKVDFVEPDTEKYSFLLRLQFAFLAMMFIGQYFAPTSVTTMMAVEQYSTKYFQFF